MANYGETLGRSVDQRIGSACTTTTTLAAVPLYLRADGQQRLVVADRSFWTLDADGVLPAGPDVVNCDSGGGQWIRSGSSGGGGASMIACRGRTSGAIGAYTRTANVIEANAVGALGAVDGVTYIAGQMLFLAPADAAATQDAGPYVIDDPGGATTFKMTRAPGADTSAEFPGLLIMTEEGTAYADRCYQVTNDSTFTLNTDAVTIKEVAFDLASIDVRISTEECTRSTADSSLTVLVASADSSLKVIQSAGDSSLTLITSSVETRLSTEECSRSTADSSLTVLIASADSSLKVIDSAGDSSLTLITSSVETRLSTEECSRSTADSSLTVLIASADSSLKVIDSAGDSSLTLITSSVETRLSTEECTRSTADSSLTVLVSSADSSLKVIQSAGDSSLTLITSSVETRLSTEECTRSTADSSLTVLVSSADSSLKVVTSTADSSLTVLVSSADSSVTVVMSAADSSLDARLDFFATRNVGMATHEFREVDANADVGNIVANGGLLASDTTPTLSGDANHAQIITWATGNADIVGCAKVLPLDFNGAQAVTVRAWVASGATDAASFSLTTHWDGGATITDAFDDSLSKSAVMHEITATIAAADVPDAPDFLWLELTPPAHATDTIILYAVAVEYASESA